MRKTLSVTAYFLTAAIVATLLFGAFSGKFQYFSPYKKQAAIQTSATTYGSASEKLDDIRFVFRYGKKKWRLSGSELIPSSDIHTVLLDIYKRGGHHSYKQKLDALKRITEMGFTGEEAVRYLFPLLDKRLDEIIAEINREPSPAYLKFYPHEPAFSVVKDTPGQKVDKSNLLERIESSLRTGSTVDIIIKPDKVYSKIDSEYVRQGTYLRSRFSTDYSHSSSDRKHNVALALSKFNGARIDSGKELSFNRTVGSRSERNGFKEGKIIKGGRFIDGFGGGVCQSSTTLYNAALLADMEIIKANQHSLEVSYVEPSFDAMVNSGSSDLVFRNNTELPVFIRTYANQERVYVEFYGVKMPYRIVRESVITEKLPVTKEDEHIVDKAGKYLDKVKYKGDKVTVQSRKEGTVSEGYLKYYDHGGRLLERKLIRKNRYKPQNALIVEGVLDRPPPPPVELALPTYREMKI